MTMTSDERIEIARRLRAAAKTKSNSADYLWKRLEIAVNGWKFGDAINDSYVFYNDVLSRLADLIDPTCHKVIPNEEEGYVFCSNCGAEIGEYGVPNYCHNCGHRLV